MTARNCRVRKKPGAYPCTTRDGADHDADATSPGDGNGNGNGNGNGMGNEFMHATMPTDFWLEGLDNGARLNWEAPARG